LPKVSDTRRPSRAAVNALRTLLERHNHIVQEVDGQNDFGEDQHVTFTEDGEVTGDLVKIQVLKTIAISPDQELDDESIADFVAEVRGYLSRYRGNRIIHAQWGEMAGVEFGPSDIVQHHVNVYGGGSDLLAAPGRGIRDPAPQRPRLASGTHRP
jgi:hypothetical protein